MVAIQSLTHRPLNRRGRLLLAPVILLLVLTNHASAAAPRYPFDPRDVEIALHVRQALLLDPELAGLNLGVSVHHGDATVWGTAPSWELAERALKVVEKVKGVYGVRSDLHVPGNHVEQDAQEMRSGLAAGIGLDLTPLMETPLDRIASQAGVLAHAPGETVPQQVLNARPALPADVAPGKDALPRVAAVTLLAPVAVTPASLSRPVVSLLPPRMTPASEEPVAHSAPELTVSVEQLRGADERFRRVLAEVRDGVVLLGGSVTEPEHLIELARSISRLPGVRSVDLRGVRMER